MSKFSGKPGHEVYIGDGSDQDSESEYENFERIEKFGNTLISRIHENSVDKRHARKKRSIVNRINNQ